MRALASVAALPPTLLGACCLTAALVSACAASAPPMIPPSPPAAPTITVGEPSVSPSIIVSTVDPTASPKSSPSPKASGSPKPSPSPSQPILQLPTTVVAGMVRDEDGKPIDGVTVKVNSLELTYPFTTSTTAFDGSYVINNMPVGVNVEVITSKDGCTSRRRVGSFQATAGQRNEFDFGHPDANDVGAPYFISRYLEIVKATFERPSDYHFRLQLSEPLDDQNRRRFEEAVQVLPANKDATGVDPFIGNFVETRAPDGTVIGGRQGVIRKGTVSGSKRVTTSWNDGGTEMTMNIPAALIRRIAKGRYQLLLVSPASGERIVDKDDRALGLSDAGSWTDKIPANQLIRATFLRPDLTVSSQQATPAGRWSTTHTDALEFSPTSL